MSAHSRFSMFGLVLSLSMILGACTKSLDTRYTPVMARLQQADTLHGLRLGIATFDDRRAGVRTGDPDTRRYIGYISPYRFGLTHKGKDMVPVPDLIQSLFVEEFSRAGIDA